MRRRGPHRHTLSRPLTHPDGRSANRHPDANTAAAHSRPDTHADPDSHHCTPLPHAVASANRDLHRNSAAALPDGHGDSHTNADPCATIPHPNA